MGCHYMFPDSELKDIQKQFTENLWKLKHSLTPLPIEICSSTSSSLIIIANFWKHLILIHIKASFSCSLCSYSWLFQWIYMWNNEMKYLKDQSYEVLKPQLWSIKPASIIYSFGVNSWKPVILGDLLQKCDFFTVMPFFLLLAPDNEFLQKFWTINAHYNEEFTMKHWEKLLCKVCGRFLWSISPDTMVIWM